MLLIDDRWITRLWYRSPFSPAPRALRRLDARPGTPVNRAMDCLLCHCTTPSTTYGRPHARRRQTRCLSPARCVIMPSLTYVLFAQPRHTAERHAITRGMLCPTPLLIARSRVSTRTVLTRPRTQRRQTRYRSPARYVIIPSLKYILFTQPRHAAGRHAITRGMLCPKPLLETRAISTRAHRTHRKTVLTRRTPHDRRQLRHKRTFYLYVAAIDDSLQRDSSVHPHSQHR